MKEYNFINIIKNLTNSTYLGDDCAYLKDLGIVVTQDNFIEDIHFKTSWATPYQIGYKAATVNISDILASGAKPAYLSVGLSLPNIDNEYFKELYKGIIAGSYGAEIIGGDITGADKISISITAIGNAKNRKISSRSHAKPGYIVISNGNYGKSSLGLEELRQGIKQSINISAHLEPKIDPKFSESISTQITEEYAMMDTSDGLADALFQIAKSSQVKIKTNEINGMFSAEDYNLVAAVPRAFLNKLSNYIVIGEVYNFDGTFLEIGKNKFIKHKDLKLFDHFNS